MPIDFTVFFRAVDGIVTFVLIGCLGYYLAKRAWFGDEAVGLLSRLVTHVAIPAYLFHHLTSSFDREALAAMAPGVLPPFLAILVTMILGWSLATLIRSRNRGLFTVGFSCSNAVNIGLPINLALFGPEGVPYVLLYFVGNTLLFWSVGNYLILSDVDNPAVPKSLRHGLGKVFSPPMLAFFAAVAVVGLGVPVPRVLANSLDITGNMNAALVMISIGATIRQMGFGNLKLDREVLLIAMGRFLVSPLVMIAISYLMPMPPLMRSVFIIQSSMPVLTNSAMLAINYGSNVDYAARSVCLTTLMAIAAIPVYMMVAEGLAG